MVKIEVNYVFEVELNRDEKDFDETFLNMKEVVERDIDNFVLSNKHLLKNCKIYYDLIG